MRLDLFLRVSRLIIRRTVAHEMCEAGAVRVNHVTAKSSREVKPGDVITMRVRGRIITARVLEVPAQKQVSKSAAASLVEIVSNEPDLQPE